MSDGLEFEETPAKDYKRKPKTDVAKTKITKPKKVENMNKEQYKKTKAAHKVAIRKLKQDIKKHKMLIKQAKLVYKITKMKESAK